jgi:hypothetical protein
MASSSLLLEATCTAPVNIAVVKYWGKRNVPLILPTNSSLSVTLNQDDLRSLTTARAVQGDGKDRLWLNGEEEDIKEGGRTARCLEEMRALRKQVEVRLPSFPWCSLGLVGGRWWERRPDEGDPGWKERSGSPLFRGLVLFFYGPGGGESAEKRQSILGAPFSSKRDLVRRTRARYHLESCSGTKLTLTFSPLSPTNRPPTPPFLLSPTSPFTSPPRTTSPPPPVSLLPPPVSPP